jgi:ribosomal protein L23
MKLIRSSLIIVATLLSLNVNANIIQDSLDFLTSIGDKQGFWLYQPNDYVTQPEAIFLKAYQYASNGKTLCTMVEEQRALFKPLINSKISDFGASHALLFLSDGQCAKRKQIIQRFAKRYGLKVITLNTFTREAKLKKAFMRFDAHAEDVFILNPKKRQITRLRGNHPCLLEQDFFFLLYDNMPQPRGAHP